MQKFPVIFDFLKNYSEKDKGQVLKKVQSLKLRPQEFLLPNQSLHNTVVTLNKGTVDLLC